VDNYIRDYTPIPKLLEDAGLCYSSLSHAYPVKLSTSLARV